MKLEHFKESPNRHYTNEQVLINLAGLIELQIHEKEREISVLQGEVQALNAVRSQIEGLVACKNNK